MCCYQQSSLVVKQFINLRRIALIAFMGMICQLGCDMPLYWRVAKSRPLERDLLGAYKVSKFSGMPDPTRFFKHPNSIRLELAENGLARIGGIEDGDLGSRDELNPRYAHWEIKDDGDRWMVCLAVTGNRDWSCFTVVLGARHGYQLYTILGDPDSNRGIEFMRVKSVLIYKWP